MFSHLFPADINIYLPKPIFGEYNIFILDIWSRELEDNKQGEHLRELDNF